MIERPCQDGDHPPAGPVTLLEMLLMEVGIDDACAARGLGARDRSSLLGLLWRLEPSQILASRQLGRIDEELVLVLVAALEQDIFERSVGIESPMRLAVGPLGPIVN